MLFNIRTMAITAAIMCGGSVLLVGLGNLIFPSYGVGFLDLMSSIYPGYDGPGGFGSVIVGTMYALVDGVIVGAIFAWVYNFVAAKAPSAA